MFPRLPPPPPPSPLLPCMYRLPQQSPRRQRKVHTCTYSNVVYYTPHTASKLRGYIVYFFDPSASQSRGGFGVCFFRKRNSLVSDPQNLIQLCNFV